MISHISSCTSLHCKAYLKGNFGKSCKIRMLHGVKHGSFICALYGIADIPIYEANDPEPDVGEALVRTAEDKDWRVRAAALDAIALREDGTLISRIVPAMDDKNDIVRFTAAACVAHLSGLPQKPNTSNTSKP